MGHTDKTGRRPIVVGTAGHVDHGKTALVKALTGVDTDRLPEERAREISIELGFAPLTLPDGTTCSLVDVPGHERFIKNMLAGATGVDVVLLVVDAREGVREQTREHLDILGLLGVRLGVAALTKIDTIPAAAVGPAGETLSAYLAGTSLAGCPVVPVSARTGEGLSHLLAALAVAAGQVTRPGEAVPDSAEVSASASAPGPASAPAIFGGPARLAIDRAFLISGFGQVVTGTVANGTIAEGQRLQLYPAGPIVRVRRLEVHGRPVPRVTAGERAALNLAGDLKDVSLRGLVLAEPGTLEPATCLGLSLRLLSGPDPVKDLERVRFHAGTAETLGRIILLDQDQSDLGLPVPVVFEAEVPLAVALGQAFVIRRYSPPRTIGGGTVTVPNLDHALGGRPRGRSARRAAATLLAAGSGGGPPRHPPVPGGFSSLATYLKLIGSGSGSASAAAPLPPGVRLLAGGQHVAEEAFYQAVWSETADRLRTRHEARPHLASAGREVLWSWLKGRGLSPSVWLESFASEGLLTLEGGRVRLGGWTPLRTEVVETARRALDAALREGRFSPPSLPPAGAGLPQEVFSAALETLLEDGQVVCPSGLAGGLAGEPVFHRQAIDIARQRLEEHLDRHGEVTVAEFRDMLGSTRKFVLPLLEYFDREKVTFRRGDLRVRHPSRRDDHGGEQRE